MAIAAPSTLYKVAALLYAICIPGHIELGLSAVHPALATIKPVGKARVGARGAQNAWNYFNGSLLVAALLNWQWSRVGGPQTLEEKIMLATFFVAGGINSVRYIQVGAYPPLLCLFAAPMASLLAWYSS